MELIPVTKESIKNANPAFYDTNKLDSNELTPEIIKDYQFHVILHDLAKLSLTDPKRVELTFTWILYIMKTKLSIIDYSNPDMQILLYNFFNDFQTICNTKKNILR